jgi:hypothetical protein
MSVSREEIQPNNDRNERYKTVVQKWSRKGRETEEEEEGGRKWLGVQIRAGRSFLGDDCARAFFFFLRFFNLFLYFCFPFCFLSRVRWLLIFSMFQSYNIYICTLCFLLI